MSLPAVEECALCNDSGFVLKQSETDKHPRAEKCECRIRQRSKFLLKYSKIPAKYIDASFDNFEASEESRSLVAAKFQAMRFVESWPVMPEPGILFWGSFGSGKTHLAIAMLKMLIETKGAKCVFRSYSDLLQQLQSTYSKEVIQDEDREVVVTTYSVIEDICSCDVLVLDDIGREKLTEWNRSMLYHVINQRYTRKLSTIITTNLPWDIAEGEPKIMNAAQRAMKLESLRERVGEAIHSRLEEMCKIVHVQGPKDFRRKVQ